jgi:hypothetical protein
MWLRGFTTLAITSSILITSFDALPTTIKDDECLLLALNHPFAPLPMN